MAVFATDSTRFSAVVKFELEPQLGICRESIVINDAAATLRVGAVMGKVTATGKWKLALSAAVDGSQNPAGVLIIDSLGSSTDIVLAANTDTKAIVLARGPVIVADAALQLGTGTTLAAATTALKALGILVETAV
jgi:hypothetical protein